MEPHVKTTIKQCFRCLAFGHLIADCTDTQCCTRCGGQHPHKDCPTDRNSPTCANCAKDDKIPPGGQNHAASDRSCPTRIRLLREARRLDLKNPISNPNIILGTSAVHAPVITSRTAFPALKTTSNLGFSNSFVPAANEQKPSYSTTLHQVPGIN